MKDGPDRTWWPAAAKNNFTATSGTSQDEPSGDWSCHAQNHGAGAVSGSAGVQNQYWGTILALALQPA